MKLQLAQNGLQMQQKLEETLKQNQSQVSNVQFKKLEEKLTEEIDALRVIVDGCISKAQFGEFAETVDYTEKKVHLLK